MAGKLLAQITEEDMRTHYSNGPLPEKRWVSDSVKPFSKEPKDQGLYVATTYEAFFAEELTQKNNKNGAKPK